MPSYYDAVLSEFVPSYGWVYYELSSSQSDTGYPHSQDPSENQSQSNVGLETIQSYPHSVDDSAPSHHQLDAEHGYSPESEKADQFEPNHSTENCSFSDPGVYGEFGNRTTDQHPNLRFAGHSEQDLSAQRYERSANPSQSPRTFSEAAQPGPLEGIGTRFTMRTYPRPECLMTQQQGHHDPQSTLRYQNNEPCSAFSSGQQSDWNKGYPLPNTCKRTESPWSPEVMGGRNQQINVPVACRYSIGASEDSISGRNSSHGISGLPTDRDRATPTSSLNTSSTDIGQVAHLTETSLTSYYARDTLDASQSHEHCPISEAWAGQRQLNYLHSNDGAHTMDDTRHLGVPQHLTPRPHSASPIPSIVNETATLLCGIGGCCSLFKGEYRKGNLARHKRLKHGDEEKTYSCNASGCRKYFKRQDARLKHQRAHHTELSPGPVLRRKIQT